MPDTTYSVAQESAQLQSEPWVELIEGDCREVLATLPEQSVNCIVTSPPYFGLRDYGHADQIGLEPTPDEFVAAMVEVMRLARRVLRDDGTLWLNLGDSYAANRSYQVNSTKGGPKHGPAQAAGGKASVVPEGLKPKDLIGIPWRVALALQADGWYLRQDIIWHKPNPMPESVRDRCTKSHEYIFLLSKSEKYYFDVDAIAEPAVSDNGMRNKRDVWTIPTKGFKGAHFAVMPEAVAEPCILAGCPVGGTVLNPFGGSGTVGVVARRNGRNAVLIELNPDYYDIASERLWPTAEEASK